MFAVVVPTFGDSGSRLDSCLRHVRAADPKVPIVVSDDNTPNKEFKREQEEVCYKYEATYINSRFEGQMSGNFHTACLEAIDRFDQPILIILHDDFIITKHWWEHLNYFWEYNFHKPIGTAGFPFFEAWELTMSGLLQSDSKFFKVDWNESDLDPKRVMWSVARYEDLLTLGAITKGRPPAPNFANKDGFCANERQSTLPHALTGTTNAHMSVRAEAFLEVGGFKGLSTCLLDLEFGWKLWDAGYWNLEVPGPFGLHYAKIGTAEMQKLVVPNMTSSEKAYVWEFSEAKDAFRRRWKVSNYQIIERDYIQRYCSPFDQSEHPSKLEFLQIFEETDD